MIDFSKPNKSPFKEYKGTITFPYPFVAATYRSWHESNMAYLASKNGSTPLITGTYHPNGDESKSDAIDPAKWGTLIELCNVKIANLPDGWEKDGDGEGIPFKVLGWAIPLLDEYISDNVNLKAFS